MSEITPNSACPDAAALRALLDGTLPDDQQAATQAHVDRCPTCEAALRQMTAGGESWIGMAEKLKSGNDDDPKLAAALERLKADDGSGGESSTPAADPQRTLDFLQPVDDPKLLGKLGQHEISEVVGWGGMGVVLKAYDPSLHRVVAVKVLASHLAHHAVARKRFIREAQAAAAVCHDNVITIHAIEEGGVVADAASIGSPTLAASATTRLPKIIMQFVAGGSLQERIDQEGPLELKEILRIAMQTAAGLAAAHAQGVVHRDVKPANILLENGVQRVKLTDFGLARVMDDASLTLSGVIAGTPQYMAPEQAWGRDVDARADLFSLGAVMYAMCSGHSPFRARTTMAVLKRVCEDPPRPLRAINPDVPEWLVAIIEKLLAKNPDERFQSATEVNVLLANWLAHVQQPNVVPTPKLFAPVAGRAGIAPLPSDMTDATADAALALIELQRRPEELQHRLQLLRRMFYVFSGVAIPVVLYFLTDLPNGFWTPAEAFRYCCAILAAVVCVLFLMGIVGRWLSVGDSEQAKVRARRGSHDPAASSDRRSPESPRDENDDGDLRSRPSAGSGDPRTARGSLSLKLALSPMLATIAVVSVFLVLIVEETGRQNLGSYLGFSVFQLAMTLALCSAFYCAWNTKSWIVWIGAMLFFPVAGNAFVLAVSYQRTTTAVALTCGLQALLAFAFCFGLLFVRPLLAYVSGEAMRERLSGWQQLFAIACFTIVGTPLVFLLMWLLTSAPREVPATSDGPGPSRTLVVPIDPNVNELEVRPNGFPKPKFLGSKKPLDAMPLFEDSPDATAKAATIPDSLKPLLGRWVVVSSEGAALGSAALMGDMGSSPVGSAAPSGTFGGGSAFGRMMGGGVGANVTSPPLQWLEFKADEVIAFDGREAKLVAEFSEDIEPKRLSLRHQTIPSPDVATDWRYGIYRLDRDRLIICWTNGQTPLPSEFAGDVNGFVQLLVLRREWNPPADFDPSKTPPPRAVIPFTADEAKRYQETWARSANVPVEITNSLGMKLRLIPPGAFDPFQQQMLASVYLSPYREVGVVFDPPVPSRPLYLATHEVTLGQFRKFVEATQYVTSAERLSQPMTWKSPGIAQDGEEHPVVRVSWTDASAFCKWLNETEHESYRLPQFAEWAFAARAGLAADIRIKPPVNSRLKFFDTTAPVGGDTANVFGLHDLFGNVSEWTFELSVQPGEISLDSGQARPEDKRRAFNLGGGFRSAMSDWQTATGGRPILHAKAWLFPREVDDPSTFDDVGFRVAREVAKQGKPSDKLDEPSAKP